MLWETWVISSKEKFFISPLRVPKLPWSFICAASNAEYQKSVGGAIAAGSDNEFIKYMVGHTD